MPADPLPSVRLIRCLKCGKTIECKPADLLKFTKSHWPKCCADVMTLFTPTRPPPKS
jgi:hypothetical protein